MSFDLNIQNYSKEELEEIFDLPKKYDISIIEMRESKLKDNIYSDDSIPETMRNKTIDFLKQAKENLIFEFNKLKSELKSEIKDLNFTNNDLSLKPSKITSENGSQFIIERSGTSYQQSYPSEFFPGTINPLKKRSIRQYLNIDTKFRDNYYNTQSTNFHFDLPIKFSNILTMQLSSFEIETTYYVISKQYGNNFFWVSIIKNVSDGSDEYDGTNQSNEINRAVIFIPDGNYAQNDLIIYLNNYVSVNGPLGSTNSIFTNLAFTININQNSSGSGQMIIGFNKESSLLREKYTIELDFQSNLNGNPDYGTPLPLKLGWNLGFRLGIYENNNTYVSEGIVNLNGPKYFYLVIDDYNNNVNNGFYSAFNSSMLNKNILARISYKDSAFVNISENNLSLVTSPRQYFGPVDIQKLNIQLIDEYGRIIDLNNMDYSFCLTFQSVYDL
jgi:hypothetical protein